MRLSRNRWCCSKGANLERRMLDGTKVAIEALWACFTCNAMVWERLAWRKTFAATAWLHVRGAAEGKRRQVLT